MIRIVDIINTYIKGASLNTAPVSGPVTQANKTTTEATGHKKRKSVIVTTSLGKNSETSRLEKDLNCKIELHVTYHIVKMSHGATYDDSLMSKVDSVMTNEFDFVILQLGSNEMSDLDLSMSRKDLFEMIQTDCENLIKVAKSMVEKYDVEVFVSEKPPRYDKKNEDSKGLLEDLNSTSNSVIKTHTHLLDRVHHVRQSMLECKGERARNERYQSDGVHLTEKGVMFLNTNWVDQIRRVFTDLTTNPSNTHPRNATPGSGPDGRGRGGGNYNRGGAGWGGGSYGQGGHHPRDQSGHQSPDQGKSRRQIYKIN